MINNMPPVSKYMTPMPYTVESDDNLARACDLMQEYRIRHLPVQTGNKTIGLISAQDIQLLNSFQAVDLDSTTVESVMARNPYCVTPDTNLDFVASHMAEQRIGTALIIQENGSLVGIFTDTDALHALAEVLQTRWRRERGG
ncbi:CBS domain-containing protein [Oligoflexus tunisiensis]|uniref:CBS domain-containing protein n=1 Tax=Oligoflexus tunisiensis TaxID=708132 RepID=UPI00159F24B2|nr:CBS domain-containing protein [Oligoflexus tunisiensis]